MANELRMNSVNARGLRNKLKRKASFEQLRDSKIDVGCLQETYVTKEIVEEVEKEWKGQVIYKEETARCNGLIILLNHNIHNERILE